MSSSTYRVNYSDYVADITHSPSSTRKLATTGIGHHITTSTTSTGSTRSPVMPHYGGGAEKCVRCLKSVYLAEKKIGAGKPYHNSCFNCKNCRRKLDSATLSEHKGEIYCKSCYTKQYGAHGLISGVSMSTERTTVQETRRSSFATDLDSPMINYQPTRYRANSTDNLVDIPIVIESRRSPSPSVIKKNEIQSFIDSPYRSPDKFSPVSIHEKTPTKDRSRSPSPSAFIPVTTYLPRVEPRMVPMTTNLDSPPTANSPFLTIAALAKPRADADDFDD